MMMVQPMRPRSTHRITSTQNNYVVSSNLLGDAPVVWGGDHLISVASGVTLGSTSTGARALLFSNCGPMANAMIVNDGTISGRGGAGGASAGACADGGDGSSGGQGTRVTHPCVIENNGAMYGGGGGGGGSGGSSSDDCKSCGCDPADGNNGGNGQGSQGAAGARGGPYGTAGTGGPGGVGPCGAGIGGTGGSGAAHLNGASLCTFTVAGTTAGGETG